MRSSIYHNTTGFKNSDRVFAHGIRLLIALPAFAWVSVAAASQTKVIIDLSEQRAYLVEQGRVTLVSPIASGKPGWLTPTGDFRIFNKDIDHQSRSFGSVVDAYGRVVNSNATPNARVPRGCHYRPAPMPYFMEFSPAVGMHAGYLPGYPASHGCVRMPRDFAALFFERVHTGTRVTVVGSTKSLTHVRKAIPISPPKSLVMSERQRDIYVVSYLHSK
jgi:lipoprotein-anchoring transpeptidase ErfK/SrfK